MIPVTAPLIRDANLSDASAVNATLTAAFLNGDLAPWLVPDLDDRKRIYPEYFAMLTAHALQHGRIQIAGDGHGVAVWYVHRPRNPIPPIPNYTSRLAEITAPYAAYFTALDDAMHRNHPSMELHHYLALLAVHPDRQGQGYGSSLLSHRHSWLDTAGTPAYLEATGTRNLRLYLRHGYQSRRTFTIARGAPTLRPMWRPAGSVGVTIRAAVPRQR